jgi:DNA polymerase type B, organellar and viral
MALQLRKIAAADLETDPFEYLREPKCFDGGIFDGVSHVEFWGDDAAERLVKHLLSNFQGWIVYFHNGGNFDFHFLLDHLPLADCEFFCIGKRIVQIKCGKLDLRDSWAIIPHPLKSWGKKEIDIRKLERPVRQKHKAEIQSYRRADCSNLHAMVSGFVERFGLKLTLASTAFHVLRKQFGIPILRTTQSFDKRLRKHYFAGRVQAFALGRQMGKFECLDINSAFPAAMCSPHFYSQTFKTANTWPKKWKEQSFYVVDCIAGGALAQRMPDKGVEFPLGRGTYHTTGWELLAGIKLGHVKDLKIKYVSVPRKVRDFGEFVRHFYDGKNSARERAEKCKREGDVSGERDAKADEYFFKIILNAAYGKFGQDVSHYVDIAVRSWRDEPEGDGWVPVHDDEPRGITFYERPSPKRPGIKGEFYNVAVAASITGQVRSLLHLAMATAKRVLYCDTDSIVGVGLRVPRGTGLGEWKLEKTFDVFWGGGKKLYVAHDIAFPWHRRRPGWAKKKMKTRTGWLPRGVYVRGLGWTDRSAFKMASKGVNLPVEDLISVCEGETRTSRFDAPTYSLKRGTTFTRRTVRRQDKRQDTK